MNVNYGLFPPLTDAPRKLKKREKNERLGRRALDALEAYRAAAGAPPGERP
jgi:folate-dependent tRNA-U54 methylase TrmFO/GidA